MDGKGFQVLVAQLSDLSGVQRAALITALKRRLPVDEALQLIDPISSLIPAAAIAARRMPAAGVLRAD